MGRGSGAFHEKIKIVFNYEKFSNDRAIEMEEKKRLSQLKHFFQMALEHMYQIVPTDDMFIFDGKTWESNKKIDDNQIVKTIEYKVRDLWNGNGGGNDKI